MYNTIKIRIPNPETSRLVQEKLFTLGNKWNVGKKVLYTDSNFLYATRGNLSHGMDESTFNEIGHTEITVEELLNLKMNWKKRYD